MWRQLSGDGRANERANVWSDGGTSANKRAAREPTVAVVAAVVSDGQRGCNVPGVRAVATAAAVAFAAFGYDDDDGDDNDGDDDDDDERRLVSLRCFKQPTPRRVCCSISRRASEASWLPTTRTTFAKRRETASRCARRLFDIFFSCVHNARACVF